VFYGVKWNLSFCDVGFGWGSRNFRLRSFQFIWGYMGGTKVWLLIFRGDNQGGKIRDVSAVGKDSPRKMNKEGRGWP